MSTPPTTAIYKPKSMPTGDRNIIRSNDSASLWNCTLSPGWTSEEVQILRKALIKFGVGNWAKIIESQCLMGKTIAQMNLQTQRMLGQQSTAEFANLHIDPFVIGELNSKKVGPGIKRKNNFIVNTGSKVSREEVRRRVQENKKLYELPESEWRNIELPKPADPAQIIKDKKLQLEQLECELIRLNAKINALRADNDLILESSSPNQPSPASSSTSAAQIIEINTTTQTLVKLNINSNTTVQTSKIPSPQTSASNSDSSSKNRAANMSIKKKYSRPSYYSDDDDSVSSFTSLSDDDFEPIPKKVKY
ncbi:hypothetical protein CONCODRAFT_4704 [Conidiobolus coronatus NRRL 28638]|uniref:Myb-like domain-containing protein n=1 Tax=Conidiobolus coronatus (strain ATCC 28846 / CBS 209.66 / NRRL 28638) TaxID=796925 RepID=A0A137PBV0_CONC2|nr:hypothetical protein CONCODRAFT_4704 [Conidiobolus coronatus NRRL 28638]|eukprot:KXN72479.1 hypothetical protein CONCODRAFT_4704 [Conidiobolus coronatus NRRL 28638]